MFPAKGKFRRMLHSDKDPSFIEGTVTFPSDALDCGYIKFYIINSMNYPSGLRMVENGWIVRIDTIRATKNPIVQVGETGGFIITHTGTLKRIDEPTFALSEGIKYLRAIHFFTSFMRGAWCGPILSRGYKSGEVVWQDGITGRQSAWTRSHGCMDGHNPSIKSIEMLFQNFMTKWQSQDGDAIESLVQWYVEASLNAGGIEGSIVLVHAALELLANLKKDEGPAYLKIRNLIKDLEISPDLTEKQENLKLTYDESEYSPKLKKGAPDKWDGPRIFSSLRNAIVHDKEKRDDRPPLYDVPNVARQEALKLGLWYLELSFLKLLNYRGPYFNRINIKSEDVPWH